jgi:hypothetical protein
MTDRFQVPPKPEPSTAVSIFDIVQMRAALGTVNAPSADLTSALDTLDNIILNFAQSLKGNPNG